MPKITFGENAESLFRQFGQKNNFKNDDLVQNADFCF
jgi:hypothetical protein